MPGNGLDVIPLRIPARWDPAWFEKFIRDVLARADVRNAIEGPGIAISGTSAEEATISASEELEELLEAALVTAEASALENARQLAAEANVLELDDAGGGSTLTIQIVTHGVPFEKLTQLTGPSVLGYPLDDTGLVQAIAAGSDDQVLRRIAGVLGFGAVPEAALPDPNYIVQTDQSVYYTAASFVRGSNIVGVRYAGGESFVYVPGDLEAEKIVTVKDEAGAGDVHVRPYSP